jgi:hypothetical protein
MPFETCWKRIKRANAHRNTIATTWNDLIEKEDTYAPSVHVDDDGAGSLIVEPAYGDLLSSKVSLQLGEMLYQFRAALDACIYEAVALQTSKNPPADEKILEFPIRRCESDFKKDAWKLGPLIKERRDIVEAVQPYNALPTLSPNDRTYSFARAIGILNDWARIDRHRRLHVIGSWITKVDPEFRIPRGTRLVNLEVAASGLLERQNEVARFRVEGWSREMEIHANPNLSIDISLDEIPPACSEIDTFGRRLDVITAAVCRIVREFEISFSITQSGSEIVD